ncbi:SPOR domain-containing protein [Flexithrix dorotheae]|uniref:SPOR domain-containing protein n=1 Tax=Flexithrix dorotheae TaxID=70993 RepID=UPI000376EC7A|nr:SPOR domain-containing protein [Flexithrix dorotheae]
MGNKYLIYKYIFCIILICAAQLSKCFSQTIKRIGFSQTGMASYYPDNRNHKMTWNGEVYDANDYTAAHATIQLNSLVKITNLENNKSIIVRITDKPYTKTRIADLTYLSAKKLNMVGKTLTRVRIELLALDVSRELFYTILPIFETTGEVSPEVIEAKRFRLLNPVDPGSFTVELKEEDLTATFLPVNTYLKSGKKIFPKGFGVQVGSFAEITKAMELAQKLENLNFINIYIQAGWQNSQKNFRVLVGDYGEKEEAKEVAETLKSYRFGAFVKSHFQASSVMKANR